MIAALLLTILVLAAIGIPLWMIASDLDADNQLDNRY